MRQIDLHLTAFGLGFLQAKYVGLMRVEKRPQQALLVHGANAVHIP